MNKILLRNNNYEILLDNNIIFEDLSNQLYANYKITILHNTKLFIEYNDCTSKIKIDFILKNKVKLKLYEIKKGKVKKIQEHYILNENSNLLLNKINDVDNINENIIIDLNGIKSNINYNAKTVSKNKETYDIIINHNNIKTNALIKNNGININKGKLTYQVSSIIHKGNIECVSTQNNRIINETNNKCSILPNLYIDENNVSASHSAHIGTFSKDDIFYLQSRGISEYEANKLLIKGFLLSDIDSYIIKYVKEIIKNYWR